MIYVAATRAQRHLAVVGRSSARGNVKNGAFAVLRGGDGPRGGGDGRPRRGHVALRDVEAPAAVGDDVRPRMIPAPIALAPLPVVAAPPDATGAAGRRLSFSALSTLQTCARRFHLEYERGLRGRREAVVAGTGAASVWGGTAFGDLVHRRLARLDWAGPGPAPGWAAAGAAADGLPASPDDAARAERQVAGLLTSDIASRIRAGRIQVEVPFAEVLDGALLSGAIDLLVNEGDGRALVVNWKTHALGGERTAASVSAEYALQQALYALVALRGGWTEVTLAWVALEDVSGSPTRTVRAEDAGALEDEVRAALRPLADVARPPAATTPQPFCSGCPGLDAGCPVAALAPRPAGPQAGAGGSATSPRL